MPELPGLQELSSHSMAPLERFDKSESAELAARVLVGLAERVVAERALDLAQVVGVQVAKKLAPKEHGSRSLHIHSQSWLSQVQRRIAGRASLRNFLGSFNDGGKFFVINTGAAN